MKKIIITLIAAVAMCFICQSCMETSRVFIEPTSITLKVGETVRFTYGTKGDKLDATDIVTVSADPTIAYVYYNEVTGVSKGTTHITAGIPNTEYTARCTVTVQ